MNCLIHYADSHFQYNLVLGNSTLLYWDGWMVRELPFSARAQKEEVSIL